MYSVETCGVCVHEYKCAYEYPCSDCNVLISYCKENHFEEAEKDDDQNKSFNRNWMVDVFCCVLFRAWNDIWIVWWVVREWREVDLSSGKSLTVRVYSGPRDD